MKSVHYGRGEKTLKQNVAMGPLGFGWQGIWKLGNEPLRERKKWPGKENEGLAGETRH